MTTRILHIVLKLYATVRSALCNANVDTAVLLKCSMHNAIYKRGNKRAWEQVVGWVRVVARCEALPFSKGCLEGWVNGGDTSTSSSDGKVSARHPGVQRYCITKVTVKAPKGKFRLRTWPDYFLRSTRCNIQTYYNTVEDWEVTRCDHPSVNLTIRLKLLI